MVIIDRVQTTLNNVIIFASVAAVILLIFFILLVVVMVQLYKFMTAFAGVVLALTALIMLTFAVLAAVVAYYSKETLEKVENLYNRFIVNLVELWNNRRSTETEEKSSATDDAKEAPVTDSSKPNLVPNSGSISNRPPSSEIPANTA